MNHTCGGTPDENGKILPPCKECDVAARMDATITGIKVGIKTFREGLQQAIKEAHLSIPHDGDHDIAQSYKATQALMALVDVVADASLAGTENLAGLFEKAKEV